VFESLVAIAFQIAFRLEIYKNNIFLFKKKLFLTSAHKKIKQREK
jgi:uncharacterized membrane protein YciS (DUF1049 family)